MTEIITFHDTDLLGDREENIVWIPVKPICDAIGVRAEDYIKAINQDEILSGVRALRPVRDASGRLQDMVCLPLHHVHGWLFSIQTAKVNPDVKPRLILFKRECYQVLYDHFFGNSRQIEEDAGLEYNLLWRNKEIDTQIRLLMAERNKNVYELKVIQNRRAAIYHRQPLHEGIEDQNANRKLFNIGQQLQIASGLES